MNTPKKLLIIMLLMTMPVIVNAQTTSDPLSGINKDCDISAFSAALDEANAAMEEGDLKTIFSAMDVLAATIASTQADCLAKGTDAGIDSGETNALIAPKDDGVYLIGIDIMPGHWETTGTGDYCYWQRSRDDGSPITSHYGEAGGTITLQTSDYLIQMNGCGTAVYVETRQPELAPDAFDPKESGFYTVGIEIAPGVWHSTGTGDACYYARYDDQQGIIDNYFGDSGITITIQPGDYEVELDECGTWEYLGEP
jgi:hypothetical protein